MDIYRLTWDNPKHDFNVTTGLMVQAESEEVARRMAAKAAKSEAGSERWLDSEETECEAIGDSYEEEPSILLVRFIDG